MDYSSEEISRCLSLKPASKNGVLEGDASHADSTCVATVQEPRRSSIRQHQPEEGLPSSQSKRLWPGASRCGAEQPM